MSRFLLPFTVLLVSSLLGCSSTPKQYTIRGDGDSTLNRDISGKSLSVVVRIYQLKDAREFSKLTFDTLAAGYPDAELLGPALLDKTDVIVVPGGNYSSTEKLLDETRFVGIVGFFRNPDRHHWRQLVDVQALSGTRNGELAFKVQDCYVMLTSVKPVILPGQSPQPRGECSTPGMVASPVQNYRPGMSNTQPVQAGQRGANPAGTNRANTSSGGLPQGMPEVNVNAATPIAPTNVRIGSGGVTSVTVGEQSPGNSQPPGYYNNQPGYYGNQPGYNNQPGYYNNQPNYYGNQPGYYNAPR
ncbi:type VI secretion system lipoprotein TssJ [Propionivibrio soli]|uniref:type VI secretion system lipoprotein TssJ n=1 Tax=Propionivibrio soli TaxID=2976531 RepID=UPI0021E970DE|nr:type VI secretion system lipoprotein TssJ [Propionivibrio soli]